MPNPILIERNPELAEAIEHLLARFCCSYDLKRVEDQATLAEGLREFGNHVARHSSRAKVEVVVGDNGICSINVTASPNT